ncbi:MAG: hypothetical protein HY269_04805, partial [Deltaproteobacteria bacterium]|nr:hypothetical protein [Deltaproteobacteria bacterium]
MSIFRLIIVSIPLLNIAWWLWAELRLRSIPGGRWWRWLIGVFAAANIAGYVWLIGTRFAGLRMPAFAVMECYIWNLVILPALLGIIALIEIGHAV